MSEAPDLVELTACPRCDVAPLTYANGWTCRGCKTAFPEIAGMPWLFAEPDATIGEWRNRLHYALQQMAMQAQSVEGELAETDSTSLTGKRLQSMLNAVREHREMLRALLEPVDVHSSDTSYESYLAMRTRLPITQGISTYYNNIHRDWAWGDRENQASLEQIRAVASSQPLGKTLVLGAGAGRLAYDIHQDLDTEQTVVSDFNPLLLLIAKTVTSGDKVSLYEFPIAPKSAEDFSIKRELAAPEPARDGLEFVFCDALRPPFARASFDTVVTPWLIDIIGDDFRNQAARVNQLLNDGGRWINFGSLSFSDPRRALCYSTEEVLDIVSASGFKEPQVREESIPYMCSPASRHCRQETVFTFAAMKSKKVKAPVRHKALPDWIVTGKEPVPALQSFQSQAMSTRIYSYVMSMIDGKRTVEDMAKIMEQQKIMTAEEAVPAIRNFLTRMYDDAQRGGDF